MTQARKLILIHIILWICGILAVIFISTIAFFPWFITSGVLFMTVGSKGKHITMYFRENFPQIYIRASVSNRMNMDGVPALNIMKLSKQEVNMIPDAGIKQYVKDMIIYTRLFYISFVATVLFLVSFQNILPK